jgi:TonB-linked SusC/RagA family outer membrane protein
MLLTAFCQLPPWEPRKLKKLLLIMRLTIVLILGLCVGAQATGHAQKVTLSERNVLLKTIFKKIEKQTGYNFIYRDDWMNQSKKVDIQVSNVPLETALDLCFRDQSISYAIVGNTIVINQKEKTPAKDPDAIVAVPLMDVSGTVTNENGEYLSGASVQVKGTRQGTMTDSRGYFQLRQVDNKAILVVSFVGYKTQEVAVGDGNLSIQLKEAPGVLNENIVIGYGITTKRKNTGTVSSITAEEISRQPVSNVLATLPGRIAGTLVAQNNGLPGSAVQIQIRGQNSLSQGGIPLYVIDGVPFTNFNGGSPATDNLNAFGTSGANGGVSPFSMINPSDIERIDILKDADATAIYGSRAANGVILITTKKGKAGKTKLDVNVSRGFAKVSRFIPVLNLQQYLQLRREAFKNDGVTPNTSTAPDLLSWDTTKSTDWQKLLLGGTGQITEAQASLSGGSPQTRFLFNSAYRKESTIFPGDNRDKRASFRLNVEHNSVDRKFNASFAASYSNDNTNILTSDLSAAYNLPPDLPLYDASGKLFWATGFTNPLASLLKRYKGASTNLIGNATFRYTILPGLQLKTNFGYTTTDLDQKTTNPASSQNPVNNPTSSAVFSDNTASNYIIEPTAEYTRMIGDGKLGLLAGGSWQHNSSKGYFISGSNYSSEALLGTMSGAGTITVNYNNIVEYKYAALFGRVNYDWKSKYLLNASFRRDGSSRFGPANRFGNFGAIGAGWVFSEEPFVKNTFPFLSFGKLRGSYGTTGNDQIGNYTYLSLYSSTTVYLSNPAIYPLVLRNENIQWETTKKLELALELGLLKDRLLVTANYYRNRSGNQITFLSMPTQSGYNSITANLPAVIQNKGLELEITSVNAKSKNFEWKTAFNITFPKNKLLEFPGLDKTFFSTSYIVGMPINFSRVYHYLGVDPSSGKAMYEDLDKDNAITTNDRYIAKIGTPYYGGLSNTVDFRNWTLDLFFQFNHRFGITNILNTRPGALVNQNISWFNRWQKTGDITAIPGATTTAGSAIYNSYNQYTSSDAVWGDASYLKFRSASLSYAMPQQWISRIKMSSCRLYVQGQNIFMKAKNKYIFDTETTVPGGPSGLGTGTIGQVTPPLRTIVFGINCSF